MTEELDTIALRKGLLRRQRMIWFALLNISTLLIGGYLALTRGNGTLVVLLLMSPIIGLLSWLANWAATDPKVRERRYWPATQAMIKNATSPKHTAWEWLNDRLLWVGALLVLLLLLICG